MIICLGFSSAKPAAAATTTNENKNPFGAASTSGGLFGNLIAQSNNTQKPVFGGSTQTNVPSQGGSFIKGPTFDLIISLKHKAHSVPQHNRQRLDRLQHNQQHLEQPQHNQLRSVQEVVYLVNLHLHKKLVLEHQQHLVLHLHLVV